LQARKVRKGGFGDEKRQIVLDHLAACCNVTRAAAAAAVSVETVSSHRRRDRVFARQCREALDLGYEDSNRKEMGAAARSWGVGPPPAGRTRDQPAASRLAPHCLPAGQGEIPLEYRKPPLEEPVSASYLGIPDNPWSVS
jgi:hypothetical protein